VGRRSEQAVRQNRGLTMHEAAAMRGTLRTIFARMRSAGGTRMSNGLATAYGLRCGMRGVANAVGGGAQSGSANASIG